MAFEWTLLVCEYKFNEILAVVSQLYYDNNDW